MHTCYASSAAQDIFNSQKQRFALCLLLLGDTYNASYPIPDITMVQVSTLPNTPISATAEEEEWKKIKGKENWKEKQKG
jgi:hypothetical protein